MRVSTPVECRDPATQMVQQPAWCGDHDVDASAECLCLRADRRPAEDRRARERGVIDEPLQVVLDLDDQLAGGREDEYPGQTGGRRVAGRSGPLEQATEHRQQIGGRLAATSLRAGDHVAAGHDDRINRCLDRGGGREAAVLNTKGERRVETQLLERDRVRLHDGYRNYRLGRGRRKIPGRWSWSPGRAADSAASPPRSCTGGVRIQGVG